MVKQQKEEVDLSASLAEVWRVLTDKEREVLRNNSTIQHFKRNELIYCEGDEPRDMMCLLRGKVKIFKEGVGGRSQIIRMIKPVQYFGYRANFAQENYLTNASAFEASVVCLIPILNILLFQKKSCTFVLHKYVIKQSWLSNKKKRSIYRPV